MVFFGTDRFRAFATGPSDSNAGYFRYAPKAEASSLYDMPCGLLDVKSSQQPVERRQGVHSENLARTSSHRYVGEAVAPLHLAGLMSVIGLKPDMMRTRQFVSV
jgi:hypothetical protein